MKNLLALLLAAVLLLCAPFALAETAAENTKEISFADLLSAAESGDVNAQLQVALAYNQGSEEVEKDAQASYDWFMKAAEQGNAIGQYNVGVMHLTGQLGEVDYPTALLWLEKAARQNHPYALVNLGAMYEAGLGVDADTEKALAYYQQAADLDNGLACLQLGQLYYSSQEPDGKVKAYELFVKGAELGNSQSAYNLGVMTANGEGTEADVAAAVEWYTVAADLGHARAQTTVGAYYLGDNGVEADYDKAFHYFNLATQQGDVDGLYFLGVCYEQGFGTELNQESAKNCYELAAMMGHENAKKRLDVLQQMQAYMDVANGNEAAETTEVTPE